MLDIPGNKYLCTKTLVSGVLKRSVRIIYPRVPRPENHSAMISQMKSRGLSDVQGLGQDVTGMAKTRFLSTGFGSTTTQ